MPSSLQRIDTGLIAATRKLATLCDVLYQARDNIFSDHQQEDITIIRDATQSFQRYVMEHSQTWYALEKGALQVLRHDLRNRLNLVIGYASLLKREVGSTISPALVVTIGGIISTCQHLLAQINDLR